MNAWSPSKGAEKKRILSRRGKTKRRTPEVTVPTLSGCQGGAAADGGKH